MDYKKSYHTSSLCSKEIFRELPENQKLKARLSRNTLHVDPASQNSFWTTSNFPFNRKLILLVSTLLVYSTQPKKMTVSSCSQSCFLENCAYRFETVIFNVIKCFYPRYFGKQNTRGNVSKISLSLACY